MHTALQDAVLGANGNGEAGGAASYDYSPAEAATIAAGDTATLVYRGRGGAPFAFDAMQIGGAYEGLTATATTNSGRQVHFRDVHLSALRNLFLHRRLKGLLEIAANNEMALEITNRRSAEATVNVKLSGYNGPERIEEQKACLRKTYGYVPEPVLLSGFATLEAGAENQRVEIGGRTFPVKFRRYMIGAANDAAAATGSIRVALKVYEDTVREEVFATQVRDEFLIQEANRPYVLDPKVTMDLVASSGDQANALDVSAVFEAYRADVAVQHPA